MSIQKIVVKNYKLLKNITINLNHEINLFVGDNDAGKSTILETLSILTMGKLNGFSFDRQLKVNLFNTDVRKQYLKDVKTGKKPNPPRIIMEAYFDGYPQYKGTNNELQEDTSGIRVVVDIMDEKSNIYRQMLKSNKVNDIPVELYDVSYNYFSGNPVSFRDLPFKSVYIDMTRKEYAGLVDHFVSNNITDSLTDDEITNLAIAYNASRRQFREHEIIQKLNEIVKENALIEGRDISIDLRENDINVWKKQMSIAVDDIPFEQIGFGTQNIIKIELALRNAEEQANIVLLEEPENNLAFPNMTHLVKHIVESQGKQVFISTHSSFIANKLNLGNVILVKNGKTTPYDSLPEETKKYFTKLPGYETLRFVLASKVILVEGVTDELVIQRAYKDIRGCLPIDDGVDVIAVESLAFKRFADVANLIDKEVVIVTDNDGDIDGKIKKKYGGYIERDKLHFCYEKNETLRSIESSVLNVNCDDGHPSESFKKIISKNNSILNRNYNDVLKFMTENKSEWAFRVFEAEESINYPEYIKNAISFFS